METAAAGLQLFVLFLRLRGGRRVVIPSQPQKQPSQEGEGKGSTSQDGVGQVQGDEMNCSECDLERRGWRWQHCILTRIWLA